MARIAKSEHPKIRLMVETERRAVPEVAEMYGCTPANIYAIISRLRREDAKAEEVLPSLDISAEPALAPAPAGDLFALAGKDSAAATPPLAPPTRGGGSDPSFPPPLAGGDGGGGGAKNDIGASSAPPLPAPTLVSDRGSRGKSGSAVGGKLAKPGFGLHMRASDGEESVAPFRSLEDLLSAAKNILRGAARSPEPVWFSIQPLDLSTIDSEAA